MQKVDEETSGIVNLKIRELLDDGQWHPLSEFLPITAIVSPEVSARIYFSESGELKRAKDLGEQISRGRRILIERRLRALGRAGKVIIEGEGFHKRYRAQQSFWSSAKSNTKTELGPKAHVQKPGDRAEMLLKDIRQVAETYKGTWRTLFLQRLISSLLTMTKDSIERTENGDE